MSAIEIVPSHGSSLPPSKWRLDNVPDLVLDIIVDYLADDATEARPFDNPVYSGLHGFYPRMKGPVIVPFSQELRTMSSVTHRFRENILRRKIMTTVACNAMKEVALSLFKLRRESFGHIRHIVLAGSAWSPITHALETFLQRCSAVESLTDKMEEVAYLAHSFPGTLSDLRLILRPGKSLPQPINAPGLRQLWVSVYGLCKTERLYSEEPFHFAAKVKRLCRNVANLDILNIQPPGLSAPTMSSQDRLRSKFNMQDPLPETLESIRQLSVVIGVHFCTVDKGQPREAHWWGYYSWIITTAPKIAEIDLIMVWVVDHLSHWSGGPQQILASMGLYTLKWDEENNVLQTRPQCERDTISPDMKEFMLLLLRARPELKMITLSHDIVVEWCGRLRCAAAVRSEGPGGRETVVFNDRIDYDIVERNIQWMNEVVKRSSLRRDSDASDTSDGSMISY